MVTRTAIKALEESLEMLKSNDGSVFAKILNQNLQKVIEELRKPKSCENCSFSNRVGHETICFKLEEHIYPNMCAHDDSGMYLESVQIEKPSTFYCSEHQPKDEKND